MECSNVSLKSSGRSIPDALRPEIREERDAWRETLGLVDVEGGLEVGLLRDELRLIGGGGGASKAETCPGMGKG